MVGDKRKQYSNFSECEKEYILCCTRCRKQIYFTNVYKCKIIYLFPCSCNWNCHNGKNARSAKKERKCRYPLSTFLQQSVPIPAFRNDFPQQETKSGPKKASTKKHKLESPQPKKKRAAKKQRENAYKCRYLLLISC